MQILHILNNCEGWQFVRIPFSVHASAHVNLITRLRCSVLQFCDSAFLFLSFCVFVFLRFVCCCAVAFLRFCVLRSAVFCYFCFCVSAILRFCGFTFLRFSGAQACCETTAFPRMSKNSFANPVNLHLQKEILETVRKQ